MTPLNDARCELGEGAFWHPARAEFFWVDIIGRTLLARDRRWSFDEMPSAMGWISRDELLVATETRLLVFTLATGTSRTLCALEAENMRTRSNDGRADPKGGFWIGTMGKQAEKGAGAIWRYYRGELRALYEGLTIPNAISFPPDGRSACFTDTSTRQVMRAALDSEGWPKGAPEVWLDLSAEALNSDGAVFDAAGNFWVAQWDAARVAAYGADGQFLRAVSFPAPHTSCPAFGGKGFSDLYCTTARQGLAKPSPEDGAAFCVPGVAVGQAEHQILLSADP